MPRQFVKCVFKPGDKREYTYHNDGEPLKIGDVVRVEDPKGGWKRITVSGIAGLAPTFPTKEAKLYVPTPEEIAAAAEAKAKALVASKDKPFERQDYSGEMPDGDEGPGFDD